MLGSFHPGATVFVHPVFIVFIIQEIKTRWRLLGNTSVFSTTFKKPSVWFPNCIKMTYVKTMCGGRILNSSDLSFLCFGIVLDTSATDESNKIIVSVCICVALYVKSSFHSFFISVKPATTNLQINGMLACQNLFQCLFEYFVWFSF